VSFYHETANCSGPRYLGFSLGTGTPLARPAVFEGSIAFYASDPLKVLTFQAFENIAPGADPYLPGTCVQSPYANVTLYAGEAASFDFAAFAITPPFRLVQ
jgi:hypothetical protein